MVAEHRLIAFSTVYYLGRKTWTQPGRGPSAPCPASPPSFPGPCNHGSPRVVAATEILQGFSEGQQWARSAPEGGGVVLSSSYDALHARFFPLRWFAHGGGLVGVRLKLLQATFKNSTPVLKWTVCACPRLRPPKTKKRGGDGHKGKRERGDWGRRLYSL